MISTRLVELVIDTVVCLTLAKWETVSGRGLSHVFRKRRSLFFKKMQIVRGCDVKRNVLVYMVYSDRLIEGSPKNSTSTVPIMPWGASDQAQRCADFVEH
jgi:catabolite regulation protein CreA